mgnify:CR=1 FL=1
MDEVVDGGGWGGEGFLVPTEYEWGNGGREEEGTMSSGRACLKCEEIYKLSPRFKFLLHHSNTSRLGIGG